VRGRPDPKPQRRIVDPQAGQAKISWEARCRVCGRVPSGHPLDSLNRMHLVPKGQGGDDVPENMVPGCGSGTTGCHGLLTTHSPGWRSAAALLRRRLRPEELEYVLDKKGQEWLDAHLPA